LRAFFDGLDRWPGFARKKNRVTFFSSGGCEHVEARM
jgi:hypothetical protein